MDKNFFNFLFYISTIFYKYHFYNFCYNIWEILPKKMAENTQIYNYGYLKSKVCQTLAFLDLYCVFIESRLNLLP